MNTILPNNTKSEDKLRPNVVGIIFDNEQNVLIVSRAEDPLHWQFPQGGVDEGESDETAILREMNEELGTNSFTILDKCQEKHIYRWPEKLLRDEYVGQEQVLMLLRFTGHTFDLKPDKREIGGILWISQDKIETFLHEYRKPVWDIVKQHLQKHPLSF